MRHFFVLITTRGKFPRYIRFLKVKATCQVDGDQFLHLVDVHKPASM